MINFRKLIPSYHVANSFVKESFLMVSYTLLFILQLTE
jgi:hypothetical protein